MPSKEGSGPRYIGSRFASANPFDGLLGDVRICMTALTPARVSAAMSSDQLLPGARANVSANVQTGTLQGKVADSLTGHLIANATVDAEFAPVASFTDTTDAVGAYSLEIPAATYTVTTSASAGATAR